MVHDMVRVFGSRSRRWSCYFGLMATNATCVRSSCLHPLSKNDKNILISTSLSDFKTKSLVLVLPQHLLQNEGFSVRKRQIQNQRNRNNIKRTLSNTFQYTHSSQRPIKTRKPCFTHSQFCKDVSLG